MNMSQHSRIKSGFTLLELIIALTILGLLAGMVFSSLRLAMNAYDRSQERIREAAVRRVLLGQLKKQVGSLFPLTPVSRIGAQQDLEYDPSLLEFATNQVPLFYGNENFVAFVTVAPLILQENPGLTVVRYGLAQDEFGDHYLGAMEVPYTGLDSFLTMVQPEPSGEPLAIVKDIDFLEFQYYGYDSEGQYYDWFAYWSGQEVLAVPDALKIFYNESSVVVPINATTVGNGLQGGLQGILGTGG